METITKIREQLRPFTPHLLAMVVAIALGMSVGLMKVTGAPPPLSNADRWTLPRWAPFVAGSIRQELATSAIFTLDPSKKRADQPVEVVVPAWRFTGTVREGDRQIALIEVDKGMHIRRILPGDELPGGAKVTAVRVGELVYTDSTGDQVLKLFSSDAKLPAAATHKN
ncbi:MAG: hypothetical protein EPO08_15220 [Rhodospirillaceae bacterium]|nr:MAG: hypothetical protein EPO08_15220 [Rhodospirillaceae bacterium]